MTIDHPNQVWAMDITYVPMARGFVYLAAVVDWFSRRVLSWRVSISLEAAFCIEALEEALARHGRPEIFNTDQGSQFTSHDFTDVLLKAGIAISMAGLEHRFWKVRCRLTPTDVVVSITRDGSRRGRLGCAGVADDGRQCNASRLEQRADDAGGGRAQGHRPPVLGDRHLLEPIKVAQHVTPLGPKARSAAALIEFLAQDQSQEGTEHVTLDGRV